MSNYFYKFFDLQNHLALDYLDFLEQAKIEKDGSHDYNVAKHHIIPQAWFNRSNLKVDDSSDNIVILTYKDHFIAHYKLFKYLESTPDKDMTFRMLFPMICALSFKVNPVGYGEGFTLSDEDLKAESDKYQDALEKYHDFQTNAVWITDGKQNIRIFKDQFIPAGWSKNFRARKTRTVRITNGTSFRCISPTEDIPEGWRRGSLPTFNVETDVWITDGKSTRKIKTKQELPDGWRYGSSAIAGRRCATDGKSNIFLRDEDKPPEGWRYGMTRPTARYDRTTGMVHIFKGETSKMVSKEDLQKWLDEGWQRGRKCGNREQWLSNLRKARTGFVIVTDGTDRARIKIDELENYYARGWWLLNKRKRSQLKQKFGFSLAEISEKYGWKYNKDGSRNTV